LISYTAAQGRCGSEFSHSQDHGIRIRAQRLSDTRDIFRRVLPVGVRRNDSGAAWELNQSMIDARLERRAFSKIDSCRITWTPSEAATRSNVALNWAPLPSSITMIGAVPPASSALTKDTSAAPGL